MPAHMAATIAVFGVGILAEIVAPLHQRKYTRISLSVPAVVTMVPGVPFYRSMSHFASGDMYSAASGFVQSPADFHGVGYGPGLRASNLRQELAVRSGHPGSEPPGYRPAPALARCASSLFPNLSVVFYRHLSVRSGACHLRFICSAYDG